MNTHKFYIYYEYEGLTYDPPFGKTQIKEPSGVALKDFIDHLDNFIIDYDKDVKVSSEPNDIDEETNKIIVCINTILNEDQTESAILKCIKAGRFALKLDKD